MNSSHRSIRLTAAAAAAVLMVTACSTSDPADADIIGIGAEPTTSAPDPSASIEPLAAPPAETEVTTVEATAPATTPATTPATVDTVDNSTVSAKAESNAIPVTDTDGIELIEVRGELAAPGDRVSYEFEADSNQAFIIEQLGDCLFEGADTFTLEIEGAGLNKNFFFYEQDLEDNDDCRSVERYVAEDPGTVRLSMYELNEAATGTFNFRVLDVTDEAPVALAFGDRVAPGVPTAGSGQIESIGRHDVYRFDIEDGQSFVIEQTGDCIFDGDDTLVLSIDGADLNENSFFYEQDLNDGDDCRTVDRFDAKETGSVLMRMRALDNDISGTYSFELTDVTDSAPIQLTYGDLVGPDAPVAGAGNIEDVGVHDVYAVAVTAGDQLTIEQLGDCLFDGGDDLWLKITGGGLNETVFFNEQDLDRNDDCDKTEVFEIDETGSVLMRMRHSSNRVTGTYNFRVTNGA